MKKPIFTKSDQSKFISIYLKDEFELVDYLAENYPWFAKINEEAFGLEVLDQVFDLTPSEVLNAVDEHLNVIISSRNKPKVNEFKVQNDSFEHIDYERGQVNVHLKFSNRQDFVKHICEEYLSMIPKYENAWK